MKHYKPNSHHTARTTGTTRNPLNPVIKTQPCYSSSSSSSPRSRSSFFRRINPARRACELVVSMRDNALFFSLPAASSRILLRTKRRAEGARERHVRELWRGARECTRGSRACVCMCAAREFMRVSVVQWGRGRIRVFLHLCSFIFTWIFLFIPGLSVCAMCVNSYVPKHNFLYG